MKRAMYWYFIGVLHFVVALIGMKAGPGADPTLALGLAGIAITVCVYYRLKDAHRNPWWCLLMLVPLANLIIVPVAGIPKSAS